MVLSTILVWVRAVWLTSSDVTFADERDLKFVDEISIAQKISFMYTQIEVAVSKISRIRRMVLIKGMLELESKSKHVCAMGVSNSQQIAKKVVESKNFLFTRCFK